MNAVRFVCRIAALCFLPALCLSAAAPSATVDIIPQQVHIALGHVSTSITFSWVSWTSPSSAHVSYGTAASSLNLTVPAHFHVFVDGGKERLHRTMYTASVHDLQPGQRYFYQVTAANATGAYNSTLLDFHTVHSDVGSGANNPLRIGLLGDWGLINGTDTHNSLERLVDRNGLDLIVHVGDISYNLATDNGRVGDAFMVREQSVAGRVPYQVAPGNHEGAYNFSHYRSAHSHCSCPQFQPTFSQFHCLTSTLSASFAVCARERFWMPNEASGSPSNMYSSFNVGPVHFIAFDAERYFIPDYLGYTAMPTMAYIREQYEWLQRDLERAHHNRHQQPWIVAYAHRPMYCTHINDDWNEPWCTEDASAVRDGVAFNGGARQFGLEKLFHNYSVDMYASGHMHRSAFLTCNCRRVFGSFNHVFDLTPALVLSLS